MSIYGAVAAVGLTAASIAMQAKGGAAASTDPTIQNEMAALSREAFSDYQQRYLPLERQLGAEIYNPGITSGRINQAVAYGRQGYKNQQIGTLIEAERYGGLRNDELQKFNRLNQIYGKAAEAQTATDARAGIEEEQMAALQDFVASGRGLQGQAVGGLQSALGTEQQRNQAAYASAAQKTQANAQNAQSLLGVASMLASSSCSREYKKEIKTLEQTDALEILKALRPVSFRYKNDDSERAPRYGVILEETPREFHGTFPSTVDIMSFVGLLISATQALTEKIEASHG